MSSSNLKEAFTVEAKHQPFYTGGNVKWSADGEYLFCQNAGTISVLSVKKGIVISRLGSNENPEDEDHVNGFTLSENGKHVISHHKSGLFRKWSPIDGKLEKPWKSIHKGPVPQIAISSNNILMASGGADSSVRLWDLQHHVCSHLLKGMQGVTSVLEFHPDSEKKLIFASGDDTKIFAWDITTGQLKLSLSGHFSKVTCLSFHDDGIHMVSAGRDKVLILWDIVKKVSIRVLPVFEGLEGAFIIPSNINLPINIEKKSGLIYAAAAGEKGTVKIWEMTSGREIYCQKNSLVPAAKEEGELSISHLLFNSQLQSFAVTTVDHNIIIHSLEDFECTKQFVGYTDDILDIVYLGENGTHLGVATNSCDIKLYELESMSCQLLRGHTDLVLSLGTTPANPHLMVSAAKDNSVKLWLMCKITMKMSCIGSGVRHTGSVGSVAISQASSSFFVSASQDSCLKLWDIPKKISTTDSNLTLNAVHTVLAHQKEINCVTVSPNDKLIATGSHDKTAKLWNSENLQLLGVLRGHRGGVMCVRFSPIDQVLLTTSADRTMKLWSLSELNCLKSFEGHESSVLQAEFVTRGMQIITSAADGLIKLWVVKTSECTTTLEEHEERIRALAVSKNEDKIISGGSDSLLIIWRDVSEENMKKLIAEKERIVLEEQKLANLLKSEDLVAALRLALKLEKPSHVLRIVKGIINGNGQSLKDAIEELKPDHKEALVRCASIWNTNSKNSEPAKLVIYTLLNDFGASESQSNGLSSGLDTLIPYEDRHFRRLTKLLQEAHFLTNTVAQIKPYESNLSL